MVITCMYDAIVIKIILESPQIAILGPVYRWLFHLPERKAEHFPNT